MLEVRSKFYMPTMPPQGGLLKSSFFNSPKYTINSVFSIDYSTEKLMLTPEVGIHQI